MKAVQEYSRQAKEMAFTILVQAAMHKDRSVLAMQMEDNPHLHEEELKTLGFSTVTRKCVDGVSEKEILQRAKSILFGGEDYE